MQPYYNTTRISGEELKEAVKSARKQDDAILLIYLNTRLQYSPWQIHQLMIKAGWKHPITSSRRSITNLTKSGHLIQTSDKVVGEYGRLEYQWKINPATHPTATAQQAELF